MTNRKDRYGKLVRGWDWRTHPGRLQKAEKLRQDLGLNRTEFLEYCIDKELKMSNYTVTGIKQFATRQEAESEQATMRGWDTVIEEVPALDFLPISNENQPHFVIKCDGSKYLHDDGYVR